MLLFPPLYRRRTGRRKIDTLFYLSRMTASLSDYKLTGEFAEQLRELEFWVAKYRGSLITPFAMLTVIVSRKSVD